MNATVNAARHPQGIRVRVLLGGRGGRRRGVAGNRNHKNNNHIIVFNNEKYHFRHNFWLLFVQAKNFLFLFPLRPFVSTG